MKKNFWLALLLFLWCGLNAQTTLPGFVILNPGAVPNLADYVNALKKNDLDRFRHVAKRTTIHFREGLIVQLLSAAEMQEAGLPVDMSQVNTTSLDRTRNKQFSLDPAGRIIISVTSLKKGQ